MGTRDLEKNGVCERNKNNVRGGEKDGKNYQ